MSDALIAAIVAVLTSGATMGVVKVWLGHRAKVQMRELDAADAEAKREHDREVTGQHVLVDGLDTYRRRIAQLEEKVGELVDRVIGLTGENSDLRVRIAKLERSASMYPARNDHRDTVPERNR